MRMVSRVRRGQLPPIRYPTSAVFARPHDDARANRITIGMAHTGVQAFTIFEQRGLEPTTPDAAAAPAPLK